MERGRVVSREQLNLQLIMTFLRKAVANGGNAWKSAFEKAKAVTAQMTLEEKGLSILPHEDWGFQ